MKAIIWITFFLARCSEIKTAYNIPKADPPHEHNLMAGSRKPQLEDINFSRPSLASLWPLKPNEDFQVVFWPLEYCQSIIICLVPKEPYSDTVNIHTKPTTCQSKFVYYPQIRYLKKDFEYSYQKISLDFHAVDNQSNKYKIKTQKDKFFHRKQLKEDDGVELELLVPGDIMLISDSVGCQAHVYQSRPATFYPLAHPSMFTDKVKTYDYLIDGRPTFFEMKPAGSKKIDLLPKLKSSKFEGVSQGYCTSFARNPRYNPSEDTKIYSHSFTVEKSTAAASGKDFSMLTIRLSTCNWARLWIHESADMSKYSSSYDPKDSLDIFFDKGFILTPDSDEGVQMAGDESVSEIIQLKLHKNNVVEIAYSSVSVAYQYSHYFTWPTMHKASFKVHLIKSPMCDAQLFQPEKIIRQHGKPVIFNRFELSPCSYNVRK